MKGLKFTVGALFIAASQIGFAAGQTDLTKNWTCTTNASSSSVATEKAADDKMADNKVSIQNAFGFAASNCRDCTKITCEVND